VDALRLALEVVTGTARAREMPVRMEFATRGQSTQAAKSDERIAWARPAAGALYLGGTISGLRAPMIHRIRDGAADVAAGFVAVV
jgi:hypothetical protein